MGRGGSEKLVAGAPARSAAARPADWPEPIQRKLELNPQTNGIVYLAKAIDQGELVLDPPYQRGSVWGPERQKALIKSLTMGLPIGAIFLNRPDIMKPDVCVDGRQRLEAVKAWIDGELAVPTHWFEEQLVPEELRAQPEITYDQLTDAGRRLWNNHALVQVNWTMIEGPDATEREAELFELINFAGVTQGEMDPDSPAASAS